jgi:glycosyltransferase involved in cell wall biosynthesis
MVGQVMTVNYSGLALVQFLGADNSRYGIDPHKVSVVHNAVARRQIGPVYHIRKKRQEMIVLFLGRITFQKGPDYFVEAAAQVIQKMPGVRFVMAGSGDMLPE